MSINVNRIAEAQVEEMEHYVTHSLDGVGEDTYQMPSTDYWRCFQCGEVFFADEEEAARQHFGQLPPSMPACWYGREQLVALLRVYEEQNRTLLQTVTSLVEERIEEGEEHVA